MSERTDRWTVLEVLDWTRGHFEAKGLDRPRLDAEVLLAHVLEMKRVMLYAHFDRPMMASELADMRSLVARRSAGIPVAQLVGSREFWSLDLEVTPDVLVPRPETEILVEVARRRQPEAARVADVGTGSGAVALALARELPRARVFGLEVCPQALDVARRNGARTGLSVEWVESDLLNGLPEHAHPLDLLVANLPYIPTQTIPTLDINVRDYEPRLALDGGEDGLDLIRRLLAHAGPHLQDGAITVLESGPEQTELIAADLRSAGWTDIEIENDLAGLPRVTSGRRPRP